MELNKRVVIVGNGSSSLNAKNGSFIDDSEIVIRIKSFIITGFEEYVGTRTTIWNTKWFSFLDSSYDKQVRLWLPFVDPALPIADNSLKAINDYMLQKNFSDKKIDLELHDKLLEKVGKDYIQFLSLDELQRSFKELNMDTKLVYTKGGISLMHPTTYFYSIFLALRRFKDYKIYVTGFDGFTQGYYWNAGNINKHKKTWPHFYQIENLYIKKLIYSNRITLL